MHTEAAKNWTKIFEYLDLIRMIVMYNEEGVAWAFRKQLISVLIDFYLEKQSPLGNKLCSKKV